MNIFFSNLPLSFSRIALALCLASAATLQAQAADSPSAEPVQSVTIGPNREFLLNGKPFLPILGWLQGRETLPQLKAVGINTISGYWRAADGTGNLKTADKYGEAAWKDGLYFIPFFEPEHLEEMTRLKDAPFLLSWFHGDEPDLPRNASDARITGDHLAINPARPLSLLTDGDPKTSGVLSPMAGATVTIKYPKTVTVTRLAMGNGTDGAKASEVAVLVGGKEICRGALPNAVEMKNFDLPAPVTLSELTLKILAVYDSADGKPAPNWGTFTGIDGSDASGASVLKCQVRKEPQISPEETRQRYAAFKKFDPSRPIWMTFSSMFLEDLYDKSWYTRAQAQALYPGYAGSADVYGIDIYPIYGWNLPENIGWVAQAARQERALVGADKPVFEWIETGNGFFGDNTKPVTGLEIRNEVYQALASGCTAIGYFTHVFKPKFASFGVTPENQAAIKAINAELRELTPKLLTADAKQQPTLKLEGGLPSICHAKSDGKTTTVIAINADGKYRSGAGSFDLPGLKEGAEITVFGENRTIKAGAGKWEDKFAPLAVHIYMLNAGY